MRPPSPIRRHRRCNWRRGWRKKARALPKCNLGGGMGIPYFPGDEAVDVAAVGAALAERFADLPAVLADTHFCIELGRYLVGEAGVYLTRIVDRKESHGEIYLVTDGGLHHQLAASGNFGTVVRRNYPSAIATRFGAPVEEEASIVGCLCTPLDRLADKGGFPRAHPGDLVAIFCAGAYGASASPAMFLGQGRRPKSSYESVTERIFILSARSVPFRDWPQIPAVSRARFSEG
jgi:diaminopimelate decarboxylase